jgi:hypothetical protein
MPRHKCRRRAQPESYHSRKGLDEYYPNCLHDFGDRGVTAFV